MTTPSLQQEKQFIKQIKKDNSLKYPTADSIIQSSGLFDLTDQISNNINSVLELWLKMYSERFENDAYYGKRGEIHLNHIIKLQEARVKKVGAIYANFLKRVKATEKKLAKINTDCGVCEKKR